MTREAEEQDFLEQLIREAADQAARNWEEQEKLLETLQEVNGHGIRGGRHHMAVDVLRLLAQEYGKDLIGRVAEEAERDQKREGSDWGFRVLFDAFCEVLPSLAFDVAALVDALHAAFLTKVWVDAIYKAIENLSRRSRETAELLLQAFAARTDSKVAELALNALLGLAHFDLRDAHARALSMTHGEILVLRRAGLAALRLFHYSGTDGDLIQVTLRRLEELKSTENPETDRLLVNAYGDLIDLAEEEARRAILELAKRPTPAVQSAVGYILHRRAKSEFRHAWYREALLSLACVPTAQRDTVRCLDYCIAVGAREDVAFASIFLEAFVTSRDYGTEEGTNLTDLMTETLGVLYGDSSALETMATRWFAASDQRLHQAASDVVVHGRFGSPDPEISLLRLSKATLDAFDDRTFSLTLQHVLGYVIGGRPLAALVSSSLRREALSDAALGFIEDALSEYILYNYPGSAGDYLRALLDKGDLPEVAQGVVQRSLARSEAYLQALRGLPNLTELHPPSRRIVRLRLAEQKRNGAIMDAARKRSVILNLFPVTPLKFGASCFREMEGAFTEPVALGTFSHSIELPQGELIDPVGQHFRRSQWRSAGLAEENGEEEK